VIDNPMVYEIDRRVKMGVRLVIRPGCGVTLVFFSRRAV